MVNTTDSESLPAYFGRKPGDLAAAQMREYEALAYEIEMLGEVTRLLANPPNASQVLRNVLLESFAVHFGNVASFLWPASNPRPTDVLPHHFAKSAWAPPGARPGDLIDRVSGEVAHLTTWRLSGRHSRKEWRPLACLEALLPTLEAFASQADRERLSPKVPDEVAGLRRLVAEYSPKLVAIETNLTTTTTRSLEIHE